MFGTSKGGIELTWRWKSKYFVNKYLLGQAETVHWLMNKESVPGPLLLE